MTSSLQVLSFSKYIGNSLSGKDSLCITKPANDGDLKQKCWGDDVLKFVWMRFIGLDLNDKQLSNILYSLRRVYVAALEPVLLESQLFFTTGLDK